MLDNYNEKAFKLLGLGNAFKLAHLPFVTSNDVFGVLALEGSSGTGKTTLVGRLGLVNQRATGGGYGIYSADKVQYQDFVGIPVPNIQKGKVDILEMENAIATKEVLLIDEANRAGYDAQEKFLQLFSTRTIDGHKTKCKYIYIAMNPVLSEDENDNYEGVQPLDKAYGERVQAILTMPRFNDMSKTHQIEIMQSCFNQTSWSPTDELVEAHRKFIEEARFHYNELKNSAMESVCEYLHNFADLLHSESKKSIKLEARRMQFLIVNILGTHALNMVVNNKATLVTSALEALTISFPQRLWEQKIENTQISVAHDQSAHLLKSKITSSKDKSQSIKSLLTVLNQDIVDGKSNTEDRSKRINQMIPDVKTDAFNHYIFAFAVVRGLEAIGSNPLIKNNEEERLTRIVNEIRESKTYKQVKKLAEKANKSGKKAPLPEWLDSDLNTDDVEIYNNSFNDEISWFANGLIEKLKGLNQYDDLTFKYRDVLSEFNSIRRSIINCIQALSV
jgi:hypothetical protein